jgi:hypothetical protein
MANPPPMFRNRTRCPIARKSRIRAAAFSPPARYGSGLRIGEPRCMWTPHRSIPGRPTACRATSRTVSMSSPNFTPLTLVSVLACVLGGRSGFTRRATGAFWPSDLATSPRRDSSSSLSTLNSITPASSPARISAAVLPTPANTTGAVADAFLARYNSPPLVTSNPLPCSAISRRMDRLPLVLTE